jgi:hypothetical protein
VNFVDNLVKNLNIVNWNYFVKNSRFFFLGKLQKMEIIKYFWKNNLVNFIVFVVIIKNYWKNRKCKKFLKKNEKIEKNKIILKIYL